MSGKSIFLLTSFVWFAFFLYGVFLTLSSIHGKNDCKMTFMFEHPNYVKINFDENEKYPNYNLWAYAEGFLTEHARNLIFNGAPVLFIPGNSGSFKQSRSLASVALRKGIDNDWLQHLDFFTVDLNSEKSALFGGVLDDQTQYIEHCIRAILGLYHRLPNPPSKLVIVGHSIGGKIAQKLLSNPDTAQLINTVIALASPMEPVLNWDIHINSFYESINDYWMENRVLPFKANNTCCLGDRETQINHEESRILDDKLFITIGGGNRDLLVHPGLTNSKFSDLHATTTGIPKVWAEADHLCIVWCLQLVLVVNRFLYSIIAPPKYKGPNSRGLSFIEDKNVRLAKAEQYFLGLKRQKSNKLHTMESPDVADWIEDNRRVFTETFKTGLKKPRIQMIRLVDNVLYHSAHVDVINLESDEWVFGCEAIETTGKGRFCSKASPLPDHHTKKIPSDLPNRGHLSLNLQQLKKNNPKWTHILLHFPVSREPLKFTVDIHNPSDREFKVYMPKWYSFSSEKITDTIMGASHYQLNITGMEETHQSLEVILTPKFCSKNKAVAKVCIPWADGFDRFHKFSNDTQFYVSTPKARPINYNTTANAIIVELMLDPACRYEIQIRQSLGQMLARIVQQFSHWLPAHLIAIIALSLKHQISLTPNSEPFKCGPFHKALATCSPFFIITVTRLFFKMIIMAKILPKPETLPTSLTVSILIHGSALAILACFTGAIWAAITFCASMVHKILFRLTRMPFPFISDPMISVIEKFPASAAVLLISLAFSSCGGIALVLACVVYFILLSKMYEDYLETFVFKSAKAIAMKLFGKLKKGTTEDDTEKPKDEIDQKPTEAIEEKKSTTDETENGNKDKEVDQMMVEAMAKQREENEKKEKELAAARAEYDSIAEGLSAINFHLPLFLLLLVMTGLSIPSVVTWAKNYHFSRVLSSDPYLVHATCVIAALGVIWQMPTPRNILFYKVVSSFLYVAAVGSVLYCQDAIYRLNYIIVAIFIVVALHQMLSAKEKQRTNKDKPDFLDNLKTNFDRLKTVNGFMSN